MASIMMFQYGLGWLWRDNLSVVEGNDGEIVQVKSLVDPAPPPRSAQIKDRSVLCSTTKMKMDLVFITIIYYFKL